MGSPVVTKVLSAPSPVAVSGRSPSLLAFWELGDPPPSSSGGLPKQSLIGPVLCCWPELLTRGQAGLPHSHSTPISLCHLFPLNIELCFPCLLSALYLLCFFLIAIPHSLLICFSLAAQCLAVLLFASSPAGFHRSTYCCRPCQCNRTVGQKQAGKWGSWSQFCMFHLHVAPQT